MNDALTMMLAAMVGLQLGAIFFGGLWWTIRRATTSSRPALWFLGSLIFRMVIVLAGFYWVGQNDWRRLIACLIGLVAARVSITWMIRHYLAIQSKFEKEADHAP